MFSTLQSVLIQGYILLTLMDIDLVKIIIVFILLVFFGLIDSMCIAYAMPFDLNNLPEPEPPAPQPDLKSIIRRELRALLNIGHQKAVKEAKVGALLESPQCGQLHS